MDRMEKYPWHVKLRVWFMVKVWAYICLTRNKYYIFINKQP